MVLVRKKALVSLIICTVLLSLCNATDLANSVEDDDSDEEDCGRRCSDDDDSKLSDEAIAGIVIGILVVLFGIPILFCFCESWCCFRNRKAPGTVIAPAPSAPQYPQQQYYHNEGGQSPVFISHPEHFNNREDPSINYDSQTLKNNRNSPASAIGAVAVQVDASNSPGNDISHIYEDPPPYDEIADISSQSLSNGSLKRTSKF